MLERIKGNILPYAPTALPVEYEVTDTRRKERGDETSKEAKRAELTFERGLQQARRRADKMEATRHVITKRRFLYYAFVTVSVTIAVMGWGVAMRLIELKLDTLPLADRWTMVLLEQPWWFAAVLVPLGVLLWLKIRWYRATQSRAMKAWGELKETRRGRPIKGEGE